MPRKPPPGPINISSPLPSPTLGSFDTDPRGGYGNIGMGSPSSSGRSTPRSTIGKNGGRGSSARSGGRGGAVPLDVSFSVSSLHRLDLLFATITLGADADVNRNYSSEEGFEDVEMLRGETGGDA